MVEEVGCRLPEGLPQPLTRVAIPGYPGKLEPPPRNFGGEAPVWTGKPRPGPPLVARQAVIYCGVPDAKTAFRIAREVLASEPAEEEVPAA